MEGFVKGDIDGWLKCIACSMNRLAKEVIDCGGCVGCGTARGGGGGVVGVGGAASSSGRSNTLAERLMGDIEAMQEVIPRLWIGDWRAAQDEVLLKRNGISGIVNCAASQCVNKLPQTFEYHDVHVMDSVSEDIAPHLGPTVRWIRDHLGHSKDAACLVHCMEGKSRSATFVLAYLIVECHMPLAKALETLKRARKIIKPNVGFMASLQEL